MRLMTASRVALFPYALLILVLASGYAKRVNVAIPPALEPQRFILNSLSPEPGSAVKEDTILTADLSYQIPDFQQGEYFVCAQFSTDRPNTSSDGDFPNSDYPVLAGPEGQLRFRFPMKYVWNDREIVRPFRVRFYMNRRTGPHTSTVVAKTDPYQYQQQ